VDYNQVIISRDISLFVFVSHCWLRGWSGAEGYNVSEGPHPDNAVGDKYALCVEGIEKMLKTLAPGMKECFLWCDYGCIDQSKDPAGELKQLDKIMELCDCVFTPIYDKDHHKWELESTNLIRDFKSTIGIRIHILI
jgi:hypothetical protein